MNKINNFVYMCCGIHLKGNVITYRYIDETISDNIGKIFKGSIPIKNNVDDPRSVVYTRVNNSIEASRVSCIREVRRKVDE